MPLTDYTNCSYFNIRKSLRFVQPVSAQVYKRTLRVVQTVRCSVLRFVETVKVIDITVCRNRKAFAFFLLLTASTNRRTFFCLRFVEAVSSKKNANALRLLQTVEYFFLFCGLYKLQNSSKFFSFAVCTNRRTVENLNYLRFLQTVKQFDSEKKSRPPPSSATNPPQLPLQSKIKLTMMLTFLSIA